MHAKPGGPDQDWPSPAAQLMNTSWRRPSALSSLVAACLYDSKLLQTLPASSYKIALRPPLPLAGDVLKLFSEPWPLVQRGHLP